MAAFAESGLNPTKPPVVDDTFINRAIDSSNLNALRLALYQLTGDEDLLKLRVEQRLLRGGALVSSVVDERDVPLLKEKALKYLKNITGKPTPPIPTKERARELMDNYSGSPTLDVDFEFNYEELAFEEFPREPKWQSGPPPAAKREAHRVLIVGAGINGIAVGIQLKRLGIPFTILERYPQIGGTWFVNQYPETRANDDSAKEWDHSIDYASKRVALIGTGSTGTQLAAPVARVAASLTVYQRTPEWITAMENYRALITDDVRWIFDNVPFYWNWHCYSVHVAALQLQGLQVIDPEWHAQTGGINPRSSKIREGLTAYIKSKTSSVPGLTEKVLPTYAPLVRRLVVDNGFFDTLCLPHVELVSGRDGIDRITPTGILSKDGTLREFDMIILGCGFNVNAFFFPMEYIGRNGTHIHDAWKKDGPRSYLGITHLAQPNFFSALGPNHAPRAGGLYSWAELWAKYVGLCIAGMIEKDIKSMEVKPEVYSDYQKLLDQQLDDKIWGMPGHSYYVNSHGRANINCPFTMSEMQLKIREVNWDDYILQ
ncbi:hypothetical protein RQP46_011247 [Phenoliferia psychrophenolica]